MSIKNALDKAIKVCDTDITKNDVKKDLFYFIKCYSKFV